MANAGQQGHVPSASVPAFLTLVKISVYSESISLDCLDRSGEASTYQFYKCPILRDTPAPQWE